jgi:hypothetical protein
MSADVERLLRGKTHDRAFRQGERDTLDKVEAMFSQWAMTHPDAVVRDELWGFVNKIRSEVSKHGARL